MTYKYDPKSIMGQLDAILKPLGWHVRQVQIDSTPHGYELSISALAPRPLNFVKVTDFGTPDPACECGAAKAKTTHSSWCPRAKT